MTGHLGRRVSDLLDGRLPAHEADVAWTHVHGCFLCRDAVEREGWVKTRLSALSLDDDCASERLKGALLGMPPVGCGGPGDLLNASSPRARERRLGVAVIGGSAAVGAAVMGILALGTAPADAPGIDRRAPATHQSPAPTPQRDPDGQPGGR
ncbi:hypothetical protein GCM10023340_19200 [Nocardioides marinquilinus]|uniref:Zinc-finger domain-containing protein n=1 Tax=Nocardioides marinquilinus TaxID=1210400 RepID=A0ABP9PIL2_9ACTN